MQDALLNQTAAQKCAEIPADRRLVEDLYAHGKLSPEAKEHALNLLYPADKWGLWVSRLFLAIGSALVLSGIVYFCAFNWAKIPPFLKLAALQLGMVGCLIGAYYLTLERIGGQILLLWATVLTGVFMAVFGQIYQTGADAYQLFMMWSLLTLGWTLLSNFAPQYVLWLAITNIFLILWWDQAALPASNMFFLIFAYLVALNGGALVLREVLVLSKSPDWLKPRWIRLLLTVALLIPMCIPAVWFTIVFGEINSTSLTATALLGFVGHGLLFMFYRFKAPDMWSLAAIVFSLCIIVEAAGLRILSEPTQDDEVLALFLMGLFTLGLFTAAGIYLRKTMETLEGAHG